MQSRSTNKTYAICTLLHSENHTWKSSMYGRSIVAAVATKYVAGGKFMALKNLWQKNGFAIEIPICNESFYIIYSSLGTTKGVIKSAAQRNIFCKICQREKRTQTNQWNVSFVAFICVKRANWELELHSFECSKIFHQTTQPISIFSMQNVVIFIVYIYWEISSFNSLHKSFHPCNICDAFRANVCNVNSEKEFKEIVFFSLFHSISALLVENSKVK